jgi:peptide/nickel transport system substrate-binding protein
MKMHRKAIWLLISVALVAALVLSSCSQPAPSVTPGTTVTGTTGATSPGTTTSTATTSVKPGHETIKDSLGRTVEKPIYGGTLTLAAATDPKDFDEAFANTWLTPTLGMTNDPLVTVDWRAGPSGTNEANIMQDLYYPSFTQWIWPHLAESYEIPSPGVWIYNLRKGVLFQNKAPVNGREFTSADAAYSINRMYTKPGSWIYNAHPPTSIETPGKYTLKLTYDRYDSYDFIRSVSITYMVAKENIEQNNGEGGRNWKNAVGTGPYLLNDYVVGNSITYKKNPTYWETDPFIPGNKLPYIDTFKVLIIPDLSTRLAALRSGKIDQYWPLTYEQRQPFLTSNPQLKQRSITGGGYNIYLPNNVAPYKDIRVRDAISEAVNRDLIMNDFFHGEALRLAFPVLPSNPEYTPFDKLPQDIKDKYSYNPTNAKKLLADAGYPTGFSMKLTVNTANQTAQDMAALLKSMWDSVGINTTLVPQENAVFTSTLYAHKYTEPIWGGWLGQYLEGQLDVARTGMPNNHTLVSDAVYDAKAAELLGTADAATRLTRATALNLYMLQQDWMVNLPSPNQWAMWQPWLKRYSGEVGMGYCHIYKQYVYAWVDRDLKFEMTGKKE